MTTEQTFDRMPTARRVLVTDNAAGLSTAELERLKQFVMRLGEWMDARFEIPLLGWRFGLDPIIGLIPGIGDAATTIVSLYLVALAARCGLPRIVIARMALNVAADMLLGALPLVGDVFDVWWKANQRNAKLLTARLNQSRTESRRASTGDWLFVGAMLLGLVALFVGIVLLTLVLIRALFDGIAQFV